MPQKYQRALEKKTTLLLTNTKSVNLGGMLQTLRDEYKVRTVACEGGPTLFRSLLEQGLIDRLNLTIAPYMFGGAKAPTLTGVSKDFLPASVHCSLSDMRTIGEECFLTYRIKHQRPRRK
jgi:2,5-diamino-6-(ribosylamino)-4(3H)-pyrimidinone 5'-phosphate reductase